MKEFNEIFESQNILYVGISELLIKDYLIMINDIENVGRLIGKRTETVSAEEEREWIRKKLEKQAPVFSMIEKKSGEFIGNIELMDPTGTEAELGIAITAAKQEQGYGSEAIRALTGYGMHVLGLRRIFLSAYTYNTRALHVYEKCGFREYKRTDEDVYMEIRAGMPAGSGMHGLKDDPFYETIAKHDRTVVEYFLMADDSPCRGISSHRDAVLFAMHRVNEEEQETIRVTEAQFGSELAEKLRLWNYDIEKAEAVPLDPEDFLYVPKIVRKDRYGSITYDRETPDFLRDGRITYWYAFLEPPHGTPDTPEDFRQVNSVLFPEGSEGLEVYEWTTDWSDLFDAGHEWWGAACWSVYDSIRNRYIVMLVSATD